MPPKKRAAGETNGSGKRKKRKDSDDFDEFGDEENYPLPAGAGDANDDNADYSDVKLEGSMLSGEVLFSGGTNWDLIGRSKPPKNAKTGGGPNLWAPHRLVKLMDVKIRTVASACTACHSAVITTDGKVLTWGRNEAGQLGHGNVTRVDNPTEVSALDGLNIIDVAIGKQHTLFVTEKGTVYSCGENKYGQLGLGHQSSTVYSPTKLAYRGPPIKKVAAGGDFSMMVDIRGNLYSFGCPEYGQLGHNTDGKYFVTSNKLSFKCETVPRKVNVFIEKGRDGQISPVTDVEIRDIAAGINHSIALDSKKRVFTWGFGGYGRLGHNEPKDEMVPRKLGYFDGPNRGCTQIQAGSTFSLGVSEHGALFMWGQQKPAGEASMYPKLVQDLSGWRIRSIGCCNKSIVVAADDSLVSWGPSPTYGELGYGEMKPKSSTVAQEVKTVSSVYIHSVACGYGHTLMIAKNDTEDEKAAVDKIDVFTP